MGKYQSAVLRSIVQHTFSIYLDASASPHILADYMPHCAILVVTNINVCNILNSVMGPSLPKQLLSNI